MNASILKILIILVSFIGMFAMRYAPFAIMGKKGTPKELDRFIKYIPLGVFTALIIKDVFYKNGKLFLSIDNIKFIPLILVILISVKFKNIGLSVVSGGIIIYLVMLMNNMI